MFLRPIADPSQEYLIKEYAQSGCQ